MLLCELMGIHFSHFLLNFRQNPNFETFQILLTNMNTFNQINMTHFVVSKIT